MKILAMDTSGPCASVAAQSGEALVFEAFQQTGRTHSQSLMPLVEQALEAAGWQATDLDLIAATVGPGSFTGVRIGVTTARALSQATGVPCVGINALEAMAANVAGKGVVCAMQDARAGQVYAAAFEGTWPPKRLLEDRACPLQAFVEQARTLADRLCFVGDGALRHRDWILETLGHAAGIAPPHLLPVRAGAVAALAALRADQAGDYQTLTPYYLRLPQAERERLEREARHA